jgi:hypothetical protein
VTKRNVLRWSLFLVASLTIAVTLMVGCSSTEPDAPGCTQGETVACACGAQSGTSLCGEPCNCNAGEDTGAPVLDAGMDAPAIDTPGDATHLDEKPPPTTAYDECAARGSFGWPCNAEASGPDPSECTDTNFSECFVGGQGAWCTASCATFGVCPGSDQDGGDAGCVPVACNARGYCK